MATGTHRRPARSWRHILELGRELVADLDALPVHAEVWTEQQRDWEAAEHPSRTDPYEAGPARTAAVAEPPARALGWWADPAAAEIAPCRPTQRGRAVRRVQAYLGWRRLLR